MSSQLLSISPKNEVLHALDTIRRQLQFEGKIMDIFLCLEKEMQDSKQYNIKQTTTAQYFTLNKCLSFNLCVLFSFDVRVG